MYNSDINYIRGKVRQMNEKKMLSEAKKNRIKGYLKLGFLPKEIAKLEKVTIRQVYDIKEEM